MTMIVTDRSYPNNTHYREILYNFETEVRDHQDKKNVQQIFNTVFNDVIVPLFNLKLPEMMKVDRTNRDPFLVYRYLQSVYTNYLPCAEKEWKAGQ